MDDKETLLAKMESEDWLDTPSAAEWRKEHELEIADVTKCPAGLLAEAMYYCSSYNNRFAKELLLRTDLFDQYLSTEGSMAKAAVIDNAAERLGVVVF